MVPAHFAGDNLVAVGVVQIFFQQLHVFLGFAILLLEKAFPIVLIPDPLLAATGLEVIIGHIVDKGYPIHQNLATKCTAPGLGDCPFCFHAISTIVNRLFSP